MTGPRVVIAGPPRSGKSTRAREIAGEWPDTIVVDFDDIARAIGSPAIDHHTTDHPAHIAMIAAAMWRTAVLCIRDDPGLPAAVIHAEPHLNDLIAYGDAGFQLIEPDVTPDP